jgi:hypothetical protein
MCSVVTKASQLRSDPCKHALPPIQHLDVYRENEKIETNHGRRIIATFRPGISGSFFLNKDEHVGRGLQLELSSIDAAQSPTLNERPPFEVTRSKFS